MWIVFLGQAADRWGACYHLGTSSTACLEGKSGWQCSSHQSDCGLLIFHQYLRIFPSDEASGTFSFPALMLSCYRLYRWLLTQKDLLQKWQLYSANDLYRLDIVASHFYHLKPWKLYFRFVCENVLISAVVCLIILILIHRMAALHSCTIGQYLPTL